MFFKVVTTELKTVYINTGFIKSVEVIDSGKAVIDTGSEKYNVELSAEIIEAQLTAAGHEIR